MSDKLLTIAEIAKRINIPESTVRFYRDRFDNFIPSVGEGRSKRYRPEAAEVLRLIAEGFNRKLTAMEIEDGLSRAFPRNIDVSEEIAMTAAATQQQPIIAIPEQLQQAMARMAAAMEIIAEQKEEIAELRKHVADVEEQQAQEAAELRKHVAEIEAKQTHQEDYIAESLRKRDEQLIRTMREMLEARQAASAKQEANKSIWQRLFKRKEGGN